ncbi:MAG TPA: S24 family peptidase [Sphingomonadaceae bacterium]|jgi:phage repressor protein C with HTH and peptisase S24 domain|nr:S24 family peptidase [Sphingomonadaceae bacterium]
MSDDDPRGVLERIVRERGDDYANLSRLIGRNSAYIQQFIKRGTPRKLDEADRAKIARYFAIDEQLLGGPPTAPARASVAVPRLAVGASAGAGALVGEEPVDGHFTFDERWLRDMTKGKPEDLSIIRVSGDSMVPTLSDGDDILVDRGDGEAALRDGIYVLRRDDTLSVKRIAVNPAGRRVTIKSDNPDYRSFADVKLSAIAIIGRVVWAGRRLG